MSGTVQSRGLRSVNPATAGRPYRTMQRSQAILPVLM